MPDGAARPVEVVTFSDTNSFVSQIVTSLAGELGTAIDVSDISIVALEVETLLERWVEGNA